MPSNGINRYTGKLLSGWDHTVQSLGVLFTTKIGSRVMRRFFGSEVPSLLGKNIVPSTFLKFATAIHVATELWEPRFRLIQVTFPRETATPETIRKGAIGMALYGQYRPNALQGDFTPEDPTTVLL